MVSSEIEPFSFKEIPLRDTPKDNIQYLIEYLYFFDSAVLERNDLELLNKYNLLKDMLKDYQFYSSQQNKTKEEKQSFYYQANNAVNNFLSKHELKIEYDSR